MRTVVAVVGAGAAGVLVGATQHNQPLIRSLLMITTREEAVDAHNATAVMAASAKLANTGGLCVLSTISETGGVSSRMIQPLPVTIRDDGGGSIEV